MISIDRSKLLTLGMKATMKPELRRIEATLGQIDDSSLIHPQPPLHQTLETSFLPNRPASGQSSLQAFPVPNSASEARVAPDPPPQARPSAAARVQPFPVQNRSNSPSLPRSKPPSISSHRHAANPSLAVSLLKEIEVKVGAWQQDLEHIIQQVRSLYEEGPIVDGWLESDAPGGASQGVPPLKTATLRHAEVEHLMGYIEEICTPKPAQLTQETVETTYRLCGLDADGQIWSRLCPAQQVPYVSLAIARYQKLRILLGKKQALENRLQHLVQTLTLLHGQLEEPV